MAVSLILSINQIETINLRADNNRVYIYLFCWMNHSANDLFEFHFTVKDIFMGDVNVHRFVCTLVLYINFMKCFCSRARAQTSFSLAASLAVVLALRFVCLHTSSFCVVAFVALAMQWFCFYIEKTRKNLFSSLYLFCTFFL
jgi:hypothetical protein